ncbi:MAG: hypothetical protein AB1601_07205 [Planctomycetota bacterium]
MNRIAVPQVAASLVALALAGLPAAAGDFSFGFGFSTGGWRYVDCRPSYVCYEPAPIIYREYAYEPEVVVVRSAPNVVVSDYCPPPIVYRDRTPYAYYRDYSPRVVYRDRSPRTYYRDCSPRIHRSTRTYVSGGFCRSSPPSRRYYDSGRCSRPTPRYAPCPPRRGADVRVRW